MGRTILFWDIYCDFAVHYFVHGGELRVFPSQFYGMPVQIVQEVSDYTGFPYVEVFHKFGSSPLNSFNIMTMLSSMRVPYAAGVLQTRANKDVGVIVLTLLKQSTIHTHV